MTQAPLALPVDALAKDHTNVSSVDIGRQVVNRLAEGLVKEAQAAAPSAQPATRNTVTAVPLTAEAFQPYGAVIQAWASPSSAPNGTPVTTANQSTAAKFHRLAPAAHSYEAETLTRGGLALAQMRAASQYDVRAGATIPVPVLERHAATTQAFIPMGRGAPAGTAALEGGGTFLVIVALNGTDDRPDPATLRAFIPTAAQGISYAAGVWHSPMLTLNETTDYTVVDAQSGRGLTIDCECIDTDLQVYIPPYDPPKLASCPTPVQQTRPSRRAALTALGPTVVPEPITHDKWAPYGALIRAYPVDEAPAHAHKTGNAAKRIVKFEWLASLENSYPVDAGATTAIGVYRATPKDGLVRGQAFDIRYMERHPHTSQAFVPMGKDEWAAADKGERALPQGGKMLVVVADNGKDDRPDPATLKAFIMESSSALMYNAGVWHHPVLVLDETLDLACIETQIATGTAEDPADPRDCELVAWEGDEAFGRVAVPRK